MFKPQLFALSLALPLLFTACNKDETPAPPPGGSSTQAAPSAAAATTAEAQKLFDQATQYVKDNKLDLADKTITQLEDMKSKLPPEWGPKIDDLQKAYNTAKAAGGAKMPG